ncbi:MAG: GntR family transcriptional regulator, partial [Alphaproteobacteria bacterium]|nr:GntR family transcriptional regulator [Alphaproteobacteria bacterium]
MSEPMTLATRSREKPIYTRIQQELRSRIASGALRPGDRLPSEIELADAFSTTRMTVRHALQELVYENLIVRQKGRGSFVSEMGARVTSPIDTRECHS